jgi:hypothetical protein
MLSAITDDPILLSLFRYWDARRGGRPMPERRDIDPLGMARSVLPFVTLAEYVEGGGRIRYRLVGTEIVRRFDWDFTGRHADEIMSGSYLAFINGLYRQMREHRAPVYSESLFRWDVSGHRLTRRIYLPLGDTDVQMGLIAQTFGEGYSNADAPRVSILAAPAPLQETRSR